MLVQPAIVDRWRREGLRRCWRRCSRRPGRPCIDSACRDLIRRLAENCLWGAPRIHGELLKLGISISERTVSRYLRGRPTTRSQTWRTFVANHFGDRTFLSPVMFSDARRDDVAVDASDLSSRQAPLAIDGSCVSIHWARVDCRRPLQHTSRGVCLAQVHLQNRTGTLESARRDPPRHLRLQLASRRPGISFARACSVSPTDGSVRPVARRELSIGSSESPFVRNRVVNVVGKPNLSVGPRVFVCVAIHTPVGILAKHRDTPSSCVSCSASGSWPEPSCCSCHGCRR